MTSPDIEREVGTFVQDRTSWAVNLRKPELTVHLLVDENGIFVWFRKIPGPGGLPTGVGGRAVCLLSGGIDSPVAAYSMLKRGMRLDFVHFHSMPRTNPASIEKVREVVRQLNLFQGSARLATVPLLSIQEEIVARCPADLRVLLYRRFMFRISERIAREFRGHALVTGEALGQVSSQTVENVASVEAAVAIPVLRPLISFDKQEIIRVARQIGTYDVSIEPHMDCCSFLMPDNPATRSEPGRLSEAESVLDVDGMVEEAVEATERTRMTDTVDWQDMPAPEEATF